MKTSREKVLDAIYHRVTDALPATLYLDEALQTKLAETCGYRARDRFTNDTVRILWNVEHTIVNEKEFRDPFGVRWIRSNGGYFFEDPLLPEPNVSLIPRIKLIEEADRENILNIRRANPDKFIFYQFTMTFGERLWALRGMENYLMDLVDHPDFIHNALDVLLEMHLKALDTLVQLPIDGITFGDDFGTQKGLMISPLQFRSFYKPRMAVLYEKVRNAGLVVGAHSCGDNTAIMKDYIDLGLQVFHPLQPECMDISFIKKTYGNNLTFRGGIGTQGAVVWGSPDEVYKMVLDAAKILSRGGGYLLEPCKPLPPETPVENAMAFIEAMEKARLFQFE
jgi:uroporphyrinogen decarboxylase